MNRKVILLPHDALKNITDEGAFRNLMFLCDVLAIIHEDGKHVDVLKDQDDNPGLRELNQFLVDVGFIPAPKENVWSREYSLESVSDFYADDHFEDALTAILGFEPDITRSVKITIEEVL